jgi:hypothetical protein
MLMRITGKPRVQERRFSLNLKTGRRAEDIEGHRWIFMQREKE